ncbi:WD40/YVTN/BNR-like repeat-containing protein [Pseudomonas nunensis]|uniref:WD40/YVTN/BNR-like repeat-containing protein n=1 Tax=Pseudomonas nunensis TaxID=2961896 RepID=UPI0025B0D0F4|nr:YCF48-related protein [Pseudomonas nunensis]MDN3219648.1 YCF48-related protein [Pseudomonas nunensis]
MSNISRRSLSTAWLLAGMWCLPATYADAAPVAPVLERPALQTEHAAQSVLIDIALAGTRLVAVGERGIVITSDDDGLSWRQSDVPVSVTLTSVQFVDPKNGWAVGHSGVILHSVDGGLTWRSQLDGIRASQLLLADAKHASNSTQPATQSALRLAQQFVDDGPDKPFLDVRFDDEKHGYVIGAYGLIFRTTDGGESWQPWMQHVDNPKGMNLYSLQRDGRLLYLAGEQGYFARSDDDGATFKRLPTPHDASYFEMQVRNNGGLVVVGLRGTAFMSLDRGNSWKPAPITTTESFSVLLTLDDGRLLYADQAGQLSVQSAKDQSITALDSSSSQSITAAVQASNGNLITAGFRGINILNQAALATAAPPGEIK